MGYNRKIRNIARMLIFGTFLIQPGNLITKTDKYKKMREINIEDLPGSSCRDTDGHQHFQNQCQQKKMLACNTGNSEMLGPQKSSTQVHIQHLFTSFSIIRILRYFWEVHYGGLKCPRRKYICNWVASLICRSENRVSWSRGTFGVSVVKNQISTW